MIQKDCWDPKTKLTWSRRGFERLTVGNLLGDTNIVDSSSVYHQVQSSRSHESKPAELVGRSRTRAASREKAKCIRSNFRVTLSTLTLSNNCHSLNDFSSPLSTNLSPWISVLPSATILPTDWSKLSWFVSANRNVVNFPLVILDSSSVLFCPTRMIIRSNAMPITTAC